MSVKKWLMKKVKLLIRSFSLPLLLIALCSCSTSLKQMNQPTVVTVGIVTTKSVAQSVIALGELEKYLEKEIPNLDVKVDATTDYSLAKANICEEKWQLTFALSPVVSANGVRCGNIPIFATFGSGTYQSAFITRFDSPLKSSDEVGPEEAIKQLSGKSLALNQVSSASGFYMPLYDLYGLTLSRVNLLGSNDEIIKKVYEGKYDVGAVPLPLIKKNKTYPVGTFKIIKISRDIPEGSVLISNKLEQEIRNSIISALQKAPKEAIEGQPYDTKGEVPSYSDFMMIVERVESIQSCYKSEPARIYNCKS